MAGGKKLDGEIKKFVNQLASSRGIVYRSRTLEEIRESFKQQGIDLIVDKEGFDSYVNLEQGGKIIRQRKYSWDTNNDGKTQLIKDDLI